jgi:hypothetical protein
MLSLQLNIGSEGTGKTCYLRSCWCSSISIQKMNNFLTKSNYHFFPYGN